MAPTLYDQFVFAVNTGDQDLVNDFIKKNKDKFDDATRIAMEGVFPVVAA